MGNDGYIRFAGVCVVYDDDRWLRPMLESVLGEVSVLFVLVSDVPWNGEPADNSATLRVIEEFPDPQKKIKLVNGHWASETEQRKAGYDLCAQAQVDYCFMVDADELYDPIVLRRMQKLAVDNPHVGCWYMTCFTYWKSFRYRIDPPEGYRPPVFLKVGECTLGERRWASAPVCANIPLTVGVCHHMSYARTDDELKKKITTFSHADEVVGSWYENVWQRWDKDPALENLHPVYPEVYKRAIPQPYEALPPVLQKLAIGET